MIILGAFINFRKITDSYFQTIRGDSPELRKCWDSCMQIWQNFARVPATVSPTLANQIRPVNDSSASQPRPGQSLPPVSQIHRLKTASDPRADQMIVDGDPDRDSGHYSNLE
jgi:hypothetical protein